MREPRLVEAATRAPGRCFICGSNDGRMIDTMVDVVGDGRFYLCERTCLPLIADAAGYATPAEVAEFRGLVDEAVGRARELEEALEQASENRMVSLASLARGLSDFRAELIHELDQRQKPEQTEPVPVASRKVKAAT